MFLVRMATSGAEQCASLWGCSFGNTTLIHFEDMSIPNLTRLVNQYRGSLACFSDDVQARCLPEPPSHPLPC